MNLRGSRGATLIELIIGMVIIGMLVAMGLPTFSTWLQNTQIRTTAEAIQNGLSLARSEAVNRNTSVRFQLTSTLDNTCSLSSSSANWVVSLDDPESKCATAASETTTPRIIQIRGSNEGTTNAVVAATQNTISFSGLGRVTPVPAGNVTIDVSNPSGGTCASASGKMRCLRVVVSPGGQVRMCDPKFTSTDPQGCP
ncbi:MAG: GspH/FimT family pseudopilin [Burkholderiales bacterium]